MSLIQWSPFPLEAPSTSSRGGLIPPIDVYEEGRDVVVEASLPGVDANKIELSFDPIDRKTLLIKAVSERRTEVDESTYYRKEVRHGVLFRRVPLPVLVAEDQAKATYEQGVLKVRLPKI